MRASRIGFLALALTVIMAPTAAFAGGPLLVFDAFTDTPYAWDTSGPVDVYTDLGPLGPLSNAQADAQVQFAIAQWGAVPSSALQLTNVGDFSLVPLPDVNDFATAGQVIGAFNGGGIHVIYDSTGDVTFNFFGAPPGVLGIASPDFATGAVIDESWVVLNGSTIDGTDTNGDEWTGVITHEFGHSINLAHTETNGAVGFFGDDAGPDGCATPYTGPGLFLNDLETMYPFIDPTPGVGTGIAQKTVEHPDDVSALSDLYPAGGWPGSFATISGTVFEADGVTPITGVNVILRNVADPFVDANSKLSGNVTQGAAGPDGRFEFNGLTPGAEYVVYIDSIDEGGFSTTPTGVVFTEEWWNSAESADATIDPACDVTTIVAGGTTNADIILTDPGATLTLGDDDFVEVSLGFDFPFCDGNLYSTVFVNSNGSLSFGAGDTDFSESVTDFLDSPPRIAPLWDDLSPNQGGIVTAENVGGEFVVAFTGVPQFLAGDSNNFTVTLRPDGTYSIAYGNIDSQDALIGRTEANGASDPGGSDLSSLAQPIGFGEQTLYELFSFTPIDVANTTIEWTICEQLPAPTLVVDTTPIVVDVAVDGTEQATLDIANGTPAPAQDLVWQVSSIGLSAGQAAALGSGELRLFEPAKAMRLNAAGERPMIRTTAAKNPLAGELLRELADSRGDQPLMRAPGDNLVLDGSFEAGAFAGIWNEFSLNFGTPVCDVGSCGTGTGTGPRTGSFWTWFGGIGAFESGSMSQDVVIPAGDVIMSFWLEQIICDSPADFMSVRIDGTEVYRTDGSNAICGQLGYSQVVLDLAALGYADGASHNIEFYSEIFANNGAGTNFFVDDVVISEQVSACGFLAAAPGSGTTAGGNSDAVTLTFDATGFAPGAYDCELTVSSNGGNATIAVTMNVLEPAVDGDLLLTSTELADGCTDGFLYATLVPPAGTDPSAIVFADILLGGSLAPDPGYSQLVDLDSDMVDDALVVRFECNFVSQLIGCGDDLVVLVTSTLNDGPSPVIINFANTINNGAVFDVAFGPSWDGIPLQQIFDDEFGPGAIDAATGYEGYLCGDAITPYWLDGQVESWIVREIAGYENENTMGWYTETFSAPVIDGVDDGLIFTGADGAGASALINLPGVLRFGLWMNSRGALDAPNAPEPEVFFTNRRYNDEGPDGSGAIHAPTGGDPQALIYNISHLRGGQPAYIVAWEDLDSGAEIAPIYQTNKTDNDYNDLVVEIRAASPVPAVVANVTGQAGESGIRLQWQISGLDAVDALEIHRTAPSGATSIPATFSSNDLREAGNWTDTAASERGTYRYRIVVRFGEQSFSSQEIAVEQTAPRRVDRSQLTAAVPNPFNPQTKIQFALSANEDVTLGIFDVSGRRVRQVRLGDLSAGTHSFTWDGTDNGGAQVASGVYLVRLMTPSATDGLRVVLVK